MGMRTTTRLLLALVAGIALACFQPPKDDVLFSCDPIDDDRCPTGYTCEADGCCHKNGTDVQATYGACGLGGNETGTAGSETDTTGSETDTTGSTDTTDTGTDTTDTGSETDTETDTADGETSTDGETDTGTSDTTSG